MSAAPEITMQDLEEDLATTLVSLSAKQSWAVGVQVEIDKAVERECQHFFHYLTSAQKRAYTEDAAAFEAALIGAAQEARTWILTKVLADSRKADKEALPDFRPAVWAKYGEQTRMLEYIDAGACWFVKIRTPEHREALIRVVGDKIASIHGDPQLETAA